MSRGRRLTALMGFLAAGVACVPGGPGAPSPAPASSDGPAVRVQWQTEFGLRGSYLLTRPAGAVRGVLLLIGAPADARLPELLEQRGIATVQPEVRPWTTFLDRRNLEELEAAVRDAQQRLEAPRDAVVAGGVSLGGTGAVRYTQQCLVAGCGPASPAAVFAVDAPLDMRRLWTATNAIIRWGAAEGNLDEARMLLEQLALTLGGPPDAAAAAYLARSPFSYEDVRGGNARVLYDTPVRLYAEPDMDYWIEERRYDYYQINAFDAAAMVNRLRIQGNPRAEFIATSGRGFRGDGTRNPHSWSIVDEADLADWVARQVP